MKATQPTRTAVRVCLLVAACSWASSVLAQGDASQALESWTVVHHYAVAPFAGSAPRLSALPDTPARLNDIAGGDGVRVAIGAKGVINGVIWRSLDPDHGPWVEQASGTRNELWALTYGKGQFVAVGAYGTIVTSTNGEDWTVRSGPATSTLQAVGFTGDGFIAVGYDRMVPSGMVLLSRDGVDWRVSRIPGVNLADVAFADGRYVAVGSQRQAFGGGLILSSTNGTDWATVHTAAHPFKGLAYRKGRLVAVGESSLVATSTNGVDWTDQTLPAPHSGLQSDDLLGVAAGGDGYVAIAATWMYASRDGENWELLTASELPELTSLQHRDSGPEGFLSRIRYVKGEWLGVGAVDFFRPDEITNPLIISSTDAYHWRLVSGRTELRAVAYGNGVFAAVGAHGTVLTSRDGTDWVEQDSGTQIDLNDVQFGGRRFVAAGGRITVLSSLDGRTWSRSPVEMEPGADLSRPLLKVAFGNGVWVAGGESEDVGFGAFAPALYVASHDQGLSWKAVKPSSTGGRAVLGLAFGNGNFVARERASYERVSTDGVNWQYRGTGEDQYGTPTITPAEAWDVAYGQGLFAEISGGGEPGWGLFTTSADGLLTNWTRRLDIPKEKLGFTLSGLTSPQVGGVAFGDGRFLALGVGTIWSSANGTNWVEHDVSPADEGLWDAAYGAGVYVAVGWDGTILQSAPVEPALLDPAVKDGAFTVLARVPPGKSATVEFTESLNQPDWKTLTTVDGGDFGKSEVVTDPSPPVGVRFYRLREQ